RGGRGASLVLGLGAAGLRVGRGARAVLGSRSLLVAIAAVIGDVEARPLEEQTGSRGKQASRLLAAGRALREGVVGHALELLELVLTGRTPVLVRWHLYELVEQATETRLRAPETTSVGGDWTTRPEARNPDPAATFPL